MRKVVKRFPGVVANDHVDFTIAQGEIHALLGENGAGKSTLMQVLYGLHRMDSGNIFVNGEPARIQCANDAIALGIGMVHQEFMLVQPFSVVENTVLGLKEKSGLLLDLTKASERLRSLSAKHQLEVDPQAIVRDLPIGVQQRVEILKLLYRNAKVLILDEPTAVLTAPEKDRLFAVLRELRAEGCSIVIVTHKLNEIMELADRVTVMRDGRVITTLTTSETSSDRLAHLMVGRAVKLTVNKTSIEPSAQLEASQLAIHDLHVRDEANQEKVRGVTLSVHAGEIVGIAGVDGNGQSQLARAILNLLPIAQGDVLLRGENITHLTVAQHRERGISYVPADRRGVGSVTDLSIADNVILGMQRTMTRGHFGPFLDRSKIRAHAQTLISRFGVRGAGMETSAGKLSGGNLQKVILGREIMRGADTHNPAVMVIEQPTRGLDAGAVEAVWGELMKQRAQGAAILLISAELEELMNLADRIAVMFEGRIVGIVEAAQISVQELGVMMTGTVPTVTTAAVYSSPPAGAP